MKSLKNENKSLKVYAKLEDSQLCGEGIIHIYLKKDKPGAADETTRKLRELTNSDVTISITPYRKKPQVATGDSIETDIIEPIGEGF